MTEWLLPAAALAGAALWFSRSVWLPLGLVADAAERLAEGDFRARSRVSASGRVGRLGLAVDRLGERAAEAVAAANDDKAAVEAVLHGMVEGVLAVAADGRVLFLSPALASLLGVRGEEAPGKPYHEVARQPGLASLIDGVLRDGRGRAGEVVLLVPEERVFEAQASPMPRAGAAAGAVAVLHDVTRLRRLEHARREFVANVSHELRTPLASIRASAETALEAAADDREAREDFLRTIVAEADRLTALVGDVLDLSAIESGRQPPSPEPLDVLALARAAAERLAPVARERRVRLAVAAGPGPAARADRRQLDQIRANLLDHAVKYNRPEGSVEVAAARRGDAVELEVRDTGVGIPASALARVFERFYRVDAARSRELGGTGLGLSIVKHLAEANGGSVAVESLEGRGSTFRVTLPLA
ncbi:MAG: PAS domain-containing protein [Elusimicrobia bacterium]|nr:PAS domain-containing protein [Elusimicrobiota bacterium]